jgi:hypothetical protein
MAPPKASRPATAQRVSEPRKVVPHPGDNTFNAIKIEGNAQTRDRGMVDGNGVEVRCFGAWTAIRADLTGKRITCICSCGAARQIAVEALKNGLTRGCGCTATPTKAAPVSSPASTFASGVAEAELNAARSRHRGGGR